MSFTTNTALLNQRPRFFVDIQGVEQLLVSQTISPALLVAVRTQTRCLIQDEVDIGESTFDPVLRKRVGGGLTLRFKDDVKGGRPLRALFASRKRLTTYQTTALVSKLAVAIDVVSTANLPAFPADVFIDGETVRYAGTTPTQINGLTRGKYGSRAQIHAGSALRGAGVFTSPPSWRGRQVTLKCVYLNDNGVARSSAADEVGTIGVYLADGPPQYMENDVWELRCSEQTENYAKRRCYVGIRETRSMPAFDEIYRDPVTQKHQLYADVDAQNNWVVSPNFKTHVKVTMSSTGAFAIGAFDSIGVGYLLVDTWEPLLFPHFTHFDGNDFRWSSGQHVAHLTGDPVKVLLTLMLSKTGDLSNNATYDVLPGRERTTYGGAESRMGFGLDAAEVDVAAFEAMLGAGPSWDLLLDREYELGELLGSFCFATRSFWFFNTSGQLTVQKMRDRVPPSTASQSLQIVARNVARISPEALTVDEAEVFHTVCLKTNYDPVQDRTMVTLNENDPELSSRYPDAQGRLEIQDKFMTVDVHMWTPLSSQQSFQRTNPIDINSMEVTLRRMQQNSARPKARYAARCGWNAVELQAGQSVVVTNPRIPDLNGSTIASKVFRIIGKKPNPKDHTVDLVLQLLDDGFLIAPSGIVVSWVGGTLTMALSQTAKENSRGARPSDDFGVGWDVSLFDVSATPNTIFNTTVAAIPDGTHVQLSAGPGFVPAAGDILTVQYSPSSTRNAIGYLPQNYLFQTAADGTIGADDGTRWS